MARRDPIVGRKARIGIIEPEVIIGNPDRPVPKNRDRGQKGLPVQRRDVERRLIHANRRGPGQPAICGHGEGDVVILKVVEARILPDGV